MNIHKREVEIIFALVLRKYKKEIEYDTIINYRRALIDVIEYNSYLIDFIEELCNNAWYLKKDLQHVLDAIKAFGIEVEGV
jgi:hypothetical protein